jgi:hypothetical protein
MPLFRFVPLFIFLSSDMLNCITLSRFVPPTSTHFQVAVYIVVIRSLHAHFCVFGALPPELLQRVAGVPALVGTVAGVLDSILTAQLPPSVHLAGLLRRRDGIPAEHHSMSMAPEFTPATSSDPAVEAQHRADYDQRVLHRAQLGADNTNIHNPHSDSCRREDTPFCRMSKPSGLVPVTGVVEVVGVPVETDTSPDGRVGERAQARPEGVSPLPSGTGYQRDRSKCPLDVEDTRLLIWELARPSLDRDSVAVRDLPPDIRSRMEALTPPEQDELYNLLLRRNGTLVEFNDILTCVLGCNTAAYILGGLEQAQGALW